MNQYIKEKWGFWKLWKMGGSKEDYLAANSVLNLKYTMLKRFHKKLNSLSSTLKRAAIKSFNKLKR